MRPTDSANILLYAIDYCYGDLLNDGCWIVIVDYFGTANAAPLRAEVDALVSEGWLVTFVYYGWCTLVGQWQRK